MTNRYLVFVLFFIIFNRSSADMTKENQVFLLGNDNFGVEVVANPSKFIKEHGPRFDNTAYVDKVWCSSKTFLNSGNGLVDEFGIMGIGVLNYDKAGIGQKFIKIGVGTVVRDINDSYQFYHKYPIHKLFSVDVNVIAKDEIVFSQISENLNGYSYKYIKNYKVDLNSQTLIIEYTLINTGQNSFEFEQYNHNWFYFSASNSGINYVIKNDFPLTVIKEIPDWLIVDDRSLRFKRKITEPGYCPFDVKNGILNRVLLANNTEKQSVEFSGDFSVNRFALYVQPDAVCPEVFIKNELEPNEEAKWKRVYTFKIW